MFAPRADLLFPRGAESTPFSAAAGYAFPMIVYADSLILLNTIVDYILLLSAGKLCALPLRRWRLGLAALLGGGYALAAVLKPAVFALLTAKMLAGAGMVLLAFGLERRTLRAVVAFYGVAAAFAGAVYGAASLAGRDISGGLYLPVSLKMLLLSFAICYAVVGLVFRKAGRRAERRLHEVAVTLDGRRAAFAALEDTGNELTDPVTGDAVLVAAAEAVEALFDDPAPLYAGDVLAALEALEARGKRFRLLPCATASSGRALLLVFRPDSATVDGKRRPDLLIAVSPHTLDPVGEYQAIL